MSLINQMLRDLETRRADGNEKLSLPNEVRPLPVADTGHRWLPFLLAILIGSVVLVAIGWAVVELATAPRQESSPPKSPLSQEPAKLKLDADLTVAHVQAPAPSLPSRQASTTIPPEIPVPPKAKKAPDPAEATETSAPHVEKRPPAVDSNATPTQQARAQLNAGQRDLAEATLKQALIATPGHVAARQMLFALMMEQRRNDEALALLQEGLALRPEQTLWASNAARLQMDRGDPSGAWETLQRGLPTALNQGEYRAFCGTVLSRLKRYDEAVEHYQAALRTNPAEGRWWVGMALALEAQGKLAESREAFARAQATGKLPPELAAYVDGKLKP